MIPAISTTRVGELAWKDQLSEILAGDHEMSTNTSEIYDVAGVGFGPSGLALAIALEEQSPEASLSAVFFERKEKFGWHQNMLLPSAKMQVAFLKDLATFRNPTSTFSFVSYLYSRRRLAQFVNRHDFFPTRVEFHDYLDWAAARVADYVNYGVDVTGIRLPQDLGADHFEVEISDPGAGRSRTVRARHLVVSTGLVPTMPPGIERGEWVWHSSELIGRFEAADRRRLRRVVVAGAGQSAAEITRFLYDALPETEVAAVIPSYGYSVADSTPFANQIFDPGAVDDYYFGTDDSRAAIWRYHANTNYGVVDDEVIRELYSRTYDEEVNHTDRLKFLRLARIAGVDQTGPRLQLKVRSLLDERPMQLDADLLVCATGYGCMHPGGLLGELDQMLHRDTAGRYQVARDHKLIGDRSLPGGIYLQGGTEHTHGLSSSLLSNIAVRSGEIIDSIVDQRAERGLKHVVTGRRALAAKSRGERLDGLGNAPRHSGPPARRLGPE
jgi:L-ornithine N5-oxygenase